MNQERILAQGTPHKAIVKNGSARIIPKIFITVFLCGSIARAATLYVSTAGSDSNTYIQAQSTSTPWLTISHAVSLMLCGDTLNVVANGSYVTDAGNPTIPPYFANCSLQNAVQSSALAKFAPVGYRTNPTNDAANYGKIQFTFGGIFAGPNFYSWNAFFNFSSGVTVNTGTGQLTIASGNGLSSLANGSQVVWTPQSEGATDGNGGWYTPTAPGALVLDKKYYVVSCSVSPACGTVGSTFFLSLTSGGASLPIVSAGVAVSLGLPVGVNASTGVFTMISGGGARSLANGIPVSFSSTSLQSFGALPSGLNPEQTYCTVNVSGSTFQIATTCGGSAISSFGDIGSGMLNVANTDVPSNWRFSGLETKPVAGAFPGSFFTLGTNAATSKAGMVHNMEIDRVYSHDNPADGVNNVSRNIVENGYNINIHDSWISSAYDNEGQTIFGTQSIGPVWITNNYLAAAGEVTLYGGDWGAYPSPNALHYFVGNYYHKPPGFKRTSGSGAASGACLGPDGINPDWPGGEWYRDTVGSQTYQCNGSNVWASVGGAIPRLLTLKNMAEHKSGRLFFYFGNTFNGSYCGGQCSVFNDSMEYGSGPAMANDTISTTNNKAINSLQFMTTANQCFPGIGVCPISPGNHIVTHNLMVVNQLVCGTSFGGGCGFNGTQVGAPGQTPIHILSGSGSSAGPQFTGFFSDHNTTWISDTFPFGGISPMNANSPNGGCAPFTPVPNNQIAITNSIVAGEFLGQCDTPGTQVLTDFYVNSALANIALKGSIRTYASAGTNTVTNLFKPANNTVINFTADYHLDPTSPFSASCSSGCSGVSSDGTDLGADIDLVYMATSSGVAGTPPWDTSLQISIGSGNVIFRYTAQTNEVYTATIYSAPARISGNQIATKADSHSTAISVGTRREISLSTTASTQYWYRIANPSGSVAMVGSFKTRATGAVPLSFTEGNGVATALTSADDKALTVNATTFSAATSIQVPVNANAIRYVAPTANPSAVSMRLTP